MSIARRRLVARRTLQQTLDTRLVPMYAAGMYAITTRGGAVAPAVVVAKYRLHQHGRSLAFLNELLRGTA